MISLYRYYDENRILLYVGISLSAVARLSQHRDKPWFTNIKRVEVQYLESREAALWAEAKAIAREKPKFNICGVMEEVTQISVVVPVALKQKIERWRRQQGDVPNILEAVRRVIELGLEAGTKKSGKHGR